MFCPECGKENQEGNKFCIKCGESLSSATPQATTIADTDSPRRPVKQRKGKRAWLWLLGGAIGLLCVVLVAVLAISWLPAVPSSADPDRFAAGTERSDPPPRPSDEAMDKAIRESLKAPADWTCREEEDEAYVCLLAGDADRYTAGIAVFDAMRAGVAETYGVETTGPVTKSSIVAETPEEYRSEMEEIEVGGLPAFRVCGDDGLGGVECIVIAGYEDRPLAIKYGAAKEKFNEYEETFETMLENLRFK